MFYFTKQANHIELDLKGRFIDNQVAQSSIVIALLTNLFQNPRVETTKIFDPYVLNSSTNDFYLQIQILANTRKT